jgi:hypothetical protein
MVTAINASRLISKKMFISLPLCLLYLKMIAIAFCGIMNLPLHIYPIIRIYDE